MILRHVRGAKTFEISNLNRCISNIYAKWIIYKSIILSMMRNCKFKKQNVQIYLKKEWNFTKKIFKIMKIWEANQVQFLIEIKMNKLIRYWSNLPKKSNKMRN